MPTPWSRVLLEKLIGSQLSRISTPFMEPESSLPYSQVPITCPYPEPDQFSPSSLSSLFLKIRLNIILPSTPGSSKWSLFPRVSPPKPILPLLYHYSFSSPVQECSQCLTLFHCSLLQRLCLIEFTFLFVSNFKYSPIFSLRYGCTVCSSLQATF